MRMFIRSKLAPVLGLMLVVQGSLHAQKLSEDYDKCIAATETNFGWSKCSTGEIARQEMLLTAAWAKVSTAMKEQGTASHAALLREQRTWITYKDSACRFFASGDFGRDGTVLHFGACKSGVSAERVAALTTLSEFLKPR